MKLIDITFEELALLGEAQLLVMYYKHEGWEYIEYTSDKCRYWDSGKESWNNVDQEYLKKCKLYLILEN